MSNTAEKTQGKLKKYVFKVKCANGHKFNYEVEAKTYNEAYLSAVLINVKDEGDTVIPHSF